MPFRRFLSPRLRCHRLGQRRWSRPGSRPKAQSWKRKFLSALAVLFGRLLASSENPATRKSQLHKHLRRHRQRCQILNPRYFRRRFHQDRYRIPGPSQPHLISRRHWWILGSSWRSEMLRGLPEKEKPWDSLCPRNWRFLGDLRRFRIRVPGYKWSIQADCRPG